ncbi:MAG: hypothetical protein IJD40_12955 [Lachnospiraceae bacterium]|nr:hypothetical protein [Lachnospiraceae bacterium]
MSSTTNDFDFQKFSSILDKSRKQSKKKEYQCCIPGCNEVALLHSHLVPQSALKKYICDDKHQLIQNQIDEIHPMVAVKTGEISLETFYTIGISEAMSMPIFCKKHDNDLFCEFEGDADSADPYNPRFQILQALRAIGALRYRESRLLEQNTIKSSLSEFYVGGVYNDESQMYQNLVHRYDSTISNLYKAVETDDYDNYEFVCFELEPLKLAICDAFIDDTDLKEHIMDDEYSIPVKALYINMIPKNNNSYLFIGYDKKNVSNALIELLGKWKTAFKDGLDIKVLYVILCHCSNNWCISPDCDSRIIEYLYNNYSNDRMDVIF